MIYHTIKDRRDLMAEVAAELADRAGKARNGAALRGYNKAAYHIGRGIEIVEEASGDLLVPSGTRGGVIHRVNGRCSCEASGFCWHLALREIVAVAFARAAEEAEERAARRARAYREIDELFAR